MQSIVAPVENRSRRQIARSNIAERRYRLDEGERLAFMDTFKRDSSDSAQL